MTEPCVVCPQCEAVVATGSQPERPRYRNPLMTCPHCGIEFRWGPGDEALGEPRAAPPRDAARQASAARRRQAREGAPQLLIGTGKPEEEA